MADYPFLFIQWERPFDCSMEWFSSSVVTEEECPCLAGLVRMTEAQRIHQKQNDLQPSAHIMHMSCHHIISAHSSKATPPSSDQSSNINTSPSWESTASMKEGLNDQSEIMSDSVNASKTAAFYSKLVNLTMKNTSSGTSSSFNQSHNTDSVAFCQMKSNIICSWFK